MINSVPDRQLKDIRERGEAICKELCRQIRQLGFLPDQLSRYPLFDDAVYETVKDPYSGAEDVAGFWHGDNGGQIGSIQFHADGTFYAEFDVVLPHPGDPRWFVEAVTAWGKNDTIKAEPKLLPALQ